jgi:hypothetical protein
MLDRVMTDVLTCRRKSHKPTEVDLEADTTPQAIGPIIK